MDDEVEIIRSNKGGMKIIHRGYMYTVHKKRQGGGIRWRCTQRSLHCKGSISTGNGPPNVNMPHNHIPDPHSVALARCRQIEEEFDMTTLMEAEYDDIKDTMPLPNRSIAPKIQIPTESPLRSQPLSPTKLKVSRQVNKFHTSTPKVIEIPPPPVDEVCLRWNSHHSNMQTTFPQLLEMEKYVDVTLIAEGKTLKCHRMILSSCSPYFEEILSGISPLQHPVIILNGIPFRLLKMLTDFMYVGEVNIDQNQVPELLDIAEILKVKGLAGKTNSADNQVKTENHEPKKLPEKNNAKKQQLPNIFSNKLPTVPKVEHTLVHDPLQLLEPKYLEIPSIKPRDNKSFAKKVISKKYRKRKSSDTESTPSPPIFPIRRGTRSRPYVKVPKYYDYEDIVKPIGTESPQDTEPPFSPVLIKSEPADFDDTNATNTMPACSEMTNEYTDINDIANKLQSLEKNLDIQPIPPINTQTSTTLPAPYKIKIKSLSSMSEKSNSCVPANEDILNTEQSETYGMTKSVNSLDNCSQNLIASNTPVDVHVNESTKVVDIIPTDKEEHKSDNDLQLTDQPPVLENDKE